MNEGLESIEVLKIHNSQLKMELEKKEVVVQDMLKKLNEAMETIRGQNEHIKGMHRLSPPMHNDDCTHRNKQASPSSSRAE